jgi:hypothetical protein
VQSASPFQRVWFSRQSSSRHSRLDLEGRHSSSRAAERDSRRLRSCKPIFLTVFAIFWEKETGKEKGKRQAIEQAAAPACCLLPRARPQQQAPKSSSRPRPAAGAARHGADAAAGPRQPHTPTTSTAAASTMGCAQSTSVSQEGGGGGGSAADGAFAPFSAASFATLATKSRGKPWEHAMADDTRGGDHTMCESYGMSKAKPFHFAIASTNERLSKYQTAADGAQLVLGADNQLSLVFVTYLPLNAPCAVYKEKALGVKPLIVQGVCNLVDVYLSIDGEPQTNGHVCSGDADNDRAAAISNAVDKQVPSGLEAATQKMLEGGPPGAKPWATLVGSARNFDDGHFVYLPLMAAQGDSVDDMIIDECKSYAEGLMKHFAALLASIGPGEHEFDIRLAPRSAVTTGEDININGAGQSSSSGIGVGPYDCLEKGDPGFTHFVQSQLESQVANGGIVAAEVDGMRAKFRVDVDEALCSGNGPERFAPPFGDFADDVAEHCEVVMQIAHTGVMGAAARDILGSGPGKAAHVVLADRPDHIGNIGDFGAGSDAESGGRRFSAWAFFLNPDDEDSDDADGCMVKCWVSKYTKKNHKAVPDPKWVTENMGMFKPLKFKLSNKNIRAAMERDEQNPIGWAA